MFLDGPVELDSNTFDDPDVALSRGLPSATPPAGPPSTTTPLLIPAPSATRGASGSTRTSPSSRFDATTTSPISSCPFRRGGPGHRGDVSGGQRHALAPTTARELASGIFVTGGGQVVLRENTITDAAIRSVEAVDLARVASLVLDDISGHETGVFVFADSTGVTLVGDRIWDNGREACLAPSTSAPGLRRRAPLLPMITAVVSNGDVDVFARRERPSLSTPASFRPPPAPATGPAPSLTPVGTRRALIPMAVTASWKIVHPHARQPGVLAIFYLLGGLADDRRRTTRPLPAAGVVDFEGDPRAINGTQLCGGRDIGADEFVPPTPFDCDPPDTTFVKTPPKKTRKKTVRFKFMPDEPGTSVCQLDQRPKFNLRLTAGSEREPRPPQALRDRDRQRGQRRGRAGRVRLQAHPALGRPVPTREHA